MEVVTEESALRIDSVELDHIHRFFTYGPMPDLREIYSLFGPGKGPYCGFDSNISRTRRLATLLVRNTLSQFAADRKANNGQDLFLTHQVMGVNDGRHVEYGLAVPRLGVCSEELLRTKLFQIPPGNLRFEINVFYKDKIATGSRKEREQYRSDLEEYIKENTVGVIERIRVSEDKNKVCRVSINFRDWEVLKGIRKL